MIEKSLMIYAVIAILVSLLYKGSRIKTDTIKRLSFPIVWNMIRSLSVLSMILFFIKYVFNILLIGLIGMLMGALSPIGIVIESTDVNILGIAVEKSGFASAVIGGFLGVESLVRLSSFFALPSYRRKVNEIVEVTERENQVPELEQQVVSNNRLSESQTD